MKLRGVHGDAELAGDLFVGGALGHQRQHVAFTRRQLELASIARRAARRPHHQRGRRRFTRRGETQAFDLAEQRGQPIGQGGVIDLDRDDERRILLAHAAGLSPIVSFVLTGSPPRRRLSSAVVPTLSGPRARISARTPRSASPFQPTMTSPWSSPAAAPGPALSTPITIAPTPSLSSRTGCSASPR